MHRQAVRDRTCGVRRARVAGVEVAEFKVLEADDARTLVNGCGSACPEGWIEVVAAVTAANLAALHLLDTAARPAPRRGGLSGWRLTGYENIIDAVHLAAGRLATSRAGDPR